ncbi:MAG TPA: glutaminyl-peptide cyclotransferase [Pyrinomonadaceae bacterium]|jgi:glutamine cyclotransferase|nr:glutaminyl-peptide cyclotransferase [Pyrinomonadaceae bacterium]
MRNIFKLTLLLPAVFILAGACGNTANDNGNRLAANSAVGASPTASQPIPSYGYEVVNRWHHDAKSFSQGLVFANGVLFESSGLYGESSLRRVELETGKVTKKIDVPSKYFAEGLTIFEGKLFQLTWKEHVCFVYDPETFKMTSLMQYNHEGWGLTHDASSLIASDGSNRLYFLNPATLATTKTISVFDNGRPLTDLNELEYIKGEIYANIWHSDRIVRIDPKSGIILGWIDLTGLLPDREKTDEEAVLNGIAYDEAHDRLFVTGKLWPALFEIRLKLK